MQTTQRNRGTTPEIQLSLLAIDLSLRTPTIEASRMFSNSLRISWIIFAGTSRNTSLSSQRILIVTPTHVISWPRLPLCHATLNPRAHAVSNSKARDFLLWRPVPTKSHSGSSKNT